MRRSTFAPPVTRSSGRQEPGEDWGWCYLDEVELNSVDWPELSFTDWEKTCDTVHMWTQIVGKTRMACECRQNHWWNVAFYVTPVGLTTSAIPYRGSTFVVDFDFVLHRLILKMGDGREHVIRLYARSVADFYREYMASLADVWNRIEDRANAGGI